MSFVSKLMNQGAVPIFLVTFKDLHNRDCHFFVRSSKQKMQALEALSEGTFNIHDYGEVLACDWGKDVSEKTRRKMLDEYDFDVDSMLSNDVAQMGRYISLLSVFILASCSGDVIVGGQDPNAHKPYYKKTSHHILHDNYVPPANARHIIHDKHFSKRPVSEFCKGHDVLQFFDRGRFVDITFDSVCFKRLEVDDIADSYCRERGGRAYQKGGYMPFGKLTKASYRCEFISF